MTKPINNDTARELVRRVEIEQSEPVSACSRCGKKKRIETIKRRHVKQSSHRDYQSEINIAYYTSRLQSVVCFSYLQKTIELSYIFSLVAKSDMQELALYFDF